MRIHPTAIIEDGARLGADCIIHAHALITRHSVLGNGVVVHPFAVIGGDPQDLGFKTETESGVVIGDRTVLREHVTVNRATKPGTATTIGADCFLMATSHVAHDGQVGDRVILANQVLLAGHVHVGERAFIGGGAGIHQFCRIGESAMIGGLTRLTRDVPPYTMTSAYAVADFPPPPLPRFVGRFMRSVEPLATPANWPRQHLPRVTIRHPRHSAS